MSRLLLFLASFRSSSSRFISNFLFKSARLQWNWTQTIYLSVVTFLPTAKNVENDEMGSAKQRERRLFRGLAVACRCPDGPRVSEIFSQSPSATPHKSISHLALARRSGPARRLLHPRERPPLCPPPPCTAPNEQVLRREASVSDRERDGGAKLSLNFDDCGWFEISHSHQVFSGRSILLMPQTISSDSLGEPRWS